MRRNKRRLRQFAFPASVLAIGLSATVIVATQLKRTIDEQDRERFQVAVDLLQEDIQGRLDTYIEMLRAGAGLFAAAPASGAAEFRAFVSRLEVQHHYPGIQGIGFSARIPADGLARVVEAQRRSGLADFHVWPPEPRDEYHSILYLEPMDRRNRAAIGYDMFTEPTRQAAMVRARDTGSPAASGAVTLVQEIDEQKQPGFLIYMPVYDGAGVPATIEERRQRLRGFVYSPFRAGDLFAGILGKNPRPRAGFELYDGAPEAGVLLHRTPVEAGAARLTTTRTLEVAGRRWTAAIFSTAALHATSNLPLVPFVWWGGTIVTVLLTALALLQMRSRLQAEQAEAAIEEMYGEIHRLLASEREARAEAERVSRLKDEFLATLSHELRTPLNAVVGWADMLRRSSLDEDKRRHAIETILRNARAQSQLIEELLDMSRIISGRVRLETTVLDLRHVIASAMDVVRPTAEAKRVALAATVPDSRCTIVGDSGRLQQIVWNLLTNAIKFTPAGGRVDLSLTRAGDRLEVRVTDTGVGITPDFLPYVFDRFRQADASFTRGHGGLGLGLSIVRSLVDMHAGTVRAFSEGPGRGATFTIEFPVASTSDRAPSDEHAPRGPHGRADALDGVSILVVDDDADARELAREILAQHGARVIPLSSGTDALAAMTGGATQADVVVSDLGMPGMDGYELMRRLRATGYSGPAIALTAYAGSDDRARAIAAGYDLHIPKPFLPGDLVAACAARVSGARG